MGNAAFIVWRESIEALLVIGILYTWLRQQQAQAALRWLWAGVGAGVGLATLLALAMFSTAQWLQGEVLEIFQASMQGIAALLVVHMVLWLRRHGRQLRHRLQADAQSALASANYLGLGVLAMFAVAREGAETAVFLYGIAQDPSLGPGALVIAGASGLLAALATFCLLQSSQSWLSWPTFFRFSEIVLLCLGGALLVGALERLIGLEWLPTLADPVWDSSVLLDDNHGLGALLAGLTGYRAQPAGSLILGLTMYWLLTISLLQWPREPA